MSDTKATQAMSDEQIVAAIQVAGAHEREWKALTYDSGPYDITKPNRFTRSFVDAIQALAAAPTPIAPTADAYPIPPIFYNGDTKRDPALRAACDAQVRSGFSANAQPVAAWRCERCGEEFEACQCGLVAAPADVLPVAWIIGKDGCTQITREKHIISAYKADGWSITPLYAAAGKVTADAVAHDGIIAHPNERVSMTFEQYRVLLARAALAPSAVEQTASEAIDVRASVLEEAASEAEHWQQRSHPEHKCGEYIAGAIRTLKDKP